MPQEGICGFKECSDSVIDTLELVYPNDLKFQAGICGYHLMLCYRLQSWQMVELVNENNIAGFWSK